MQKWNISTDRPQGVDEKNGVIRLVMFTPRVMVIKMYEMAHFMYFLLNTATKSIPVWSRYLSAPKWSYIDVLENTMNYWVLRDNK